MRIRKISGRFWVVFACSIFLLALYGCNRSSSPPPNPVAQQPSSPPPPPVQSSAPTPPRPQFLDFPDIPIPTELDLRADDSYVFQAGNMKTGILTLRGRVDINSLISFFTMALPREGWKPRGQFRYKRSALIFEKPEKTCVILVHEGPIYTYVEIYVAPMT
ncbi:MAG: hypothetical protein ABFD97_16415 [Syntrophobacter sp.]